MKVVPPKKEKPKIKDTQQVFEIMQKILMRENTLGRKQQHFWLMGLDKNRKLLFIELLGLGGSHLDLEGRQILKVAVLKDAKYVIAVHNKPRQILVPNEADLLMTATLTLAAHVLGIIMLDHLIITEAMFYSFDANGLMKDMRSKAGI